MNLNFKSWLLSNGYSSKTGNNKPSTVYDYLRGIKYVCKIENISIETLAQNIANICPMYQKGGIHEVRGRQISRSVRASLVQFNKFIIEQQA